MMSRAARGEEQQTAPLGLRTTPSLLEALKRLAHAENRTLSSYVEMALQAHVANVEANKRKPSRKRRI
jgi:hypothetical protein